MEIRFTKYRRIYFTFSGLLIVASLILLFGYGLKAGIDFTGGTIMELEYKDVRSSNQDILANIEEFNLGSVSVQPTGEKGVLLRMQEITEETHQEILTKLMGREVVEAEGGLAYETVKTSIEEIRFESIGPVIGNELKEKTKIVVIVALLSMIIYIALAFRRVQRPLKSWQYGIASVLALFHDILIPLGVFVLLGRYYGVEISIPIVTALLAVLGYSINNTVVVFDRIRENLTRRGGDFEEIVDVSLNETLSRQINTSLTTIFVSATIFFWGGETLKYFALALLLGIGVGTYSSIFIAGSLLVSWYKLKKR
ncbi:protein translocase subunit SecF [Patescibacteria group bacterium]|nr:protein translocase subunit SecF [Patescibacteria group bacterium]